MINLPKIYVAELGFELVTPQTTVRHAVNCTMVLGICFVTFALKCSFFVHCVLHKITFGGKIIKIIFRLFFIWSYDSPNTVF